MALCDRCGKETKVTTMSYFNTDIICPECQTKEEAHPQFTEAKRIEAEQVRLGNLNFKGIGKPPDL